MLIEFLGVPGSGKTYLLNKLIANGINFHTRESIIKEETNFKNMILFTCNNFKFLFLIKLSFLLNLTFSLKKNYALFLGLKDTVKIYMLKKKVHKDKIVFDEGIHQRLLSLLCYKKSYINIKLFHYVLASMKVDFIPDKIVIIDPPLELCINNALNRDQGLPFRFKYLSNNNLKNKYQQYLSGINMINDKNNYCTKIIEISNIDKAINDIKEIL